MSFSTLGPEGWMHIVLVCLHSSMITDNCIQGSAIDTFYFDEAIREYDDLQATRSSAHSQEIRLS
jgi:hypothetical protein